MNEQLIGLILAGGNSSRMGFDKRKLALNGVPVITVLANELSNCCINIFLSCKKDDPPETPIKFLIDEYPFGGPLNGIMTALNRFSHHSILVVAADQPFVQQKHLDHLISENDPALPATTFLNAKTVMAEPFPSIWNPISYHLLQQFILNHRPSPLDFMKKHKIKVITTHDQDFSINLNTPEELKAFKAITRG